MIEFYCLANCWSIVYSFKVQLYLRILIYPTPWIGTCNIQLYKHTICLPRWNNVETAVSASLQRGINVMWLSGNSIRNCISLGSFFLLSPLTVSVSWNSFKQRWMSNHFTYNITRRMGIQMFAATLSLPCAIILIKRVLCAMVFMPKISSGWSAIYTVFNKQSIFDPRPKNCLGFSKKPPQNIF